MADGPSGGETIKMPQRKTPSPLYAPLSINMPSATVPLHKVLIPDPPTPSPISELPNELLQDILLLTLPISDEIPVDSESSRSTLSLTAVCHRWREIALATRQLWNRFACVEPLRRKYTSSCPSDTTTWSAILPGINSWFHRADPSAALALSLTFHTVAGSQISDLWPQMATPGQPILDHVLPWHRLASLHIDSPNLFPPTIAQMLRVSSNLKRLHVDGVNCVPYTEADAQRAGQGGLILLPNLVALTLRVGSIWTFEDAHETSLNYAFPGRAKMPAIREVVIHGQSGIQDDWLLAHSVFESLIQSQAPITRLILHELAFNAFALFDILGDFTTLEYLHVSPKDGECGGFAAACALLAYDVDEVHNTLPNLRVLIIEDNFPDFHSDGFLLYDAFGEIAPPPYDWDQIINGVFTFVVPPPYEWNQIILDMAGTRRWDPKNYPFAQDGLCQLEVLEVTLGRAENWVEEKASRATAKALLRGGLVLEYPSLSVSSKFVRDSEEIFGDDGLDFDEEGQTASDDEQNENEHNADEQGGDGEHDQGGQDDGASREKGKEEDKGDGYQD